MGNVLVFGSSGQLGQCIKYVSAQKGIENIFFPPEDQANILSIQLLTNLFDQYKLRMMLIWPEK
jgi:dTDP-4-dehydrorhamnose reductase